MKSWLKILKTTGTRVREICRKNIRNYWTSKIMRKKRLIRVCRCWVKRLKSWNMSSVILLIRSLNILIGIWIGKLRILGRVMMSLPVAWQLPAKISWKTIRKKCSSSRVWLPPFLPKQIKLLPITPRKQMKLVLLLICFRLILSILVKKSTAKYSL